MSQNDKALFSTFYLGPISYYKTLLHYSKVYGEGKEHFIKQSYRNRCSVHGANGKLDLIVPLSGRKNDTMTEDIEISYAENWQKLHWKSFEAAYRTSPYFEFYEPELRPFYSKDYRESNLMKFNSEIENVILDLLEIEVEKIPTEEYRHEAPRGTDDFREAFHPKEKRKRVVSSLPDFTIERYQQVFEDRNGFIPDLSIVDLLFNLGPEAGSYLRSI